MARVPTTAAPEPEPTESWDELDIAGHDRHIYRMSGLGGDLSQLVAGAMNQKQGPMPAWLRPYLDEGTAAEPAILKMLHDDHACRPATYGELVKLKEEGTIAGYNPAEQQVQVWLEVGKSALVRGHADEIICSDQGSEYGFSVVEAKKFRPTLWNLWTDSYNFADDPVLAKYAWQVSALHHATGLPVVFVVGRWDVDNAEITKIDVRTFSEENVPHTLAELKARVMKAEAHVKKGVVPMCDRADNDCIYAEHDFCPGKSDKEWEDIEDQTLGDLLALFHAYTVDMSQTDEQKEAKKLREEVKEKIDKHLAETGREKGKRVHVWSATGDEYEFEWILRDVKPKAGYQQSFPQVTLVLESE